MKKWIKRFLYLLLVLFIILNISSAFHAYKFTHFYANAPKLEKPEEMSFGEKMKAAFLGVDYPKSKVTDSLFIFHKTITITTNDSMHLEAWHLLQPLQTDTANHTAKGTVLMFHGHGSCKSGIIKETEEFYKLGYHVLITDFRAHGNSEGEVCTVGFNESKDVKAAYDFIQATSEKNIILYGVSLGAATITKAMADFELIPTKVILEMPFGSLYEAVKGRVRIMHLPEQPISFFLTFWGGTEQGFWAFDNSPAEYAKKINVPTLLQWGKHDARVTEKETHEIFEHIATKEKKLVVYEESAHESLCKSEHDKWVSEVSSFLR